MKISIQYAAPMRVVSLALIAMCALCAVTSGQSSLASGQNFDGPAELPREHVKSSLKDTPANGKTWTVHSGQSIEKALSDASCGDIIQLQAGATFSGKVVFPSKNCDDSHWIIVRTSAADSALPPEGTRLTPCYAGVSSLPGRPNFACPTATNVLAKLEFTGKGGSGPIQFSSGANYYRMVGLELARSSSPGTIYNLVQFNGPAAHIVFDRMWLHGTAQDETVRGIMLGPTKYIAVVDSFFTDFHCIARSGACADSQAIAGGLGDDPMGPYKIENNFLEAAGENILFGGGRASTTAQDIEVRRNHMFKPLTWMKGQTGYVGAPDGNAFIVKNLFELKSAQRVLLEGNVMENSWGGFSQVGFAILLTPKNPGAGSPCTVCQVTDVTIRYDSISHVGAGLQIGNGLSDYGAAALDGQRYSIHDITIDDIDGAKYGGPSELAQISTGPGGAVLQNVKIDHITAFPSNKLLIIGDHVPPSSQMKNFVFTNSIVNAGTYPVWSTGGGAANCAVHNSPVVTFDACFSSYTFASNAIINSPPTAKWPAKNFFPGSATSVRFVNYKDGNGGDYHLQSSSPYKGRGIDNKDLGADIKALEAATSGAK